MDTGKVQDTSIGNESTVTRPLANASNEAAKPLQVAPMKNVSANTLETLAELLSLLQEDCRRYSEAQHPIWQDCQCL